MEKQPADDEPFLWLEKAACGNEDPDLFFHDGNGRVTLRQIKTAKAVCGRCAVGAECLAWSIETGQADGVLGGLSEDERRPLIDNYARRMNLQRGDV